MRWFRIFSVLFSVLVFGTPANAAPTYDTLVALQAANPAPAAGFLGWILDGNGTLVSGAVCAGSGTPGTGNHLCAYNGAAFVFVQAGAPTDPGGPDPETFIDAVQVAFANSGGGNHITGDTVQAALEDLDVLVLGSGGVGASSPTQVLYNKAGVKTGDTGLIYDDANNILTVGSVVTADVPGSNVIILNDNDSGITCNIGGGTKDIGLYTDSLNGTEDSLMICNDAGVAKAVDGPGTWVLIDEAVNFSGESVVDMIAPNWHTTYDAVRLNFFDVRPNVTTVRMRIKLINTAGGLLASATQSYEAMTVHAPLATGFQVDSGTVWRSDVNEFVSPDLNKGITGHAHLYVNPGTSTVDGVISGPAAWSYMRAGAGGVLVSQTLGFRSSFSQFDMNDQTPPQFNGGFRIDSSGGAATWSGTIRLWGSKR